MLNFEEEIKKFHPVLGIEDMEDKITTEDMEDLMELVKQSIGKSNLQHLTKDAMDKEFDQ